MILHGGSETPADRRLGEGTGVAVRRGPRAGRPASRSRPAHGPARRARPVASARRRARPPRRLGALDPGRGGGGSAGRGAVHRHAPRRLRGRPGVATSSPVAIRERAERYLLERALAVHVFFESEIPTSPGRSARLIHHRPDRLHGPGRTLEGRWGYLSWVGRYDPIHKGLDVLVDARALVPPDRRPLVRLHGYDFRGGRADLERRSPSSDSATGSRSAG